MELAKRKQRVIELLQNSEDEELIEAFQLALEQRLLPDPGIGNLTKEELIARAEASEEDIQNGNVIPIEDLIKDMENW